jgi:hypothetical protein
MTTLHAIGKFDMTGPGYGFDIALFEMGSVIADDGSKVGDSRAMNFAYSDGSKVGDSRAVFLTSIQSDGVKVGDSRAMNFAYSDGSKVAESTIQLTWTKYRSDVWSNSFRRVINLLTWTGDIWSGIAEKITSWTKRSTSSSTWTEKE